MNNEKNRQENRKALKIYIPFLIVMAVIGGILGLISTTAAAHRLTSYIEASLFQGCLYDIPMGSISFYGCRDDYCCNILQKGERTLQ